MNKQVVVGAAVGGLVFILLVILVCMMIFGSGSDPYAVVKTPADTLVNEALNGENSEIREKAAMDLARKTDPESVEGMRRVLSQSPHADVKKHVIDGLAARKDLPSMPKFLEIVQD